MSEPTPKSLGPRQYLLAAALAVSVAATLWAAQTDSEDAELAQPVAATRRSPAPGLQATPAAAQRRATEPSASASAAGGRPAQEWAPAERGAWAPAGPGQFAAWAPPAPPPPPPAPPPPPPAAPVAPPFPYQLIGRLVEGDTAVALLSSSSKTLAVKTGELVDGQWRVDQIHERGLHLTWLPAKLTQSVNFRAATP